jgi:chromosome segregation ATPase
MEPGCNSLVISTSSGDYPSQLSEIKSSARDRAQTEPDYVHAGKSITSRSERKSMGREENLAYTLETVRTQNDALELKVKELSVEKVNLAIKMSELELVVKKLKDEHAEAVKSREEKQGEIDELSKARKLEAEEAEARSQDLERRLASLQQSEQEAQLQIVELSEAKVLLEAQIEKVQSEVAEQRKVNVAQKTTSEEKVAELESRLQVLEASREELKRAQESIVSEGQRKENEWQEQRNILECEIRACADRQDALRGELDQALTSKGRLESEAQILGMQIQELLDQRMLVERERDELQRCKEELQQQVLLLEEARDVAVVSAANSQECAHVWEAKYQNLSDQIEKVWRECDESKKLADGERRRNVELKGKIAHQQKDIGKRKHENHIMRQEVEAAKLELVKEVKERQGESQKWAETEGMYRNSIAVAQTKYEELASKYEQSGMEKEALRQRITESETAYAQEIEKVRAAELAREKEIEELQTQIAMMGNALRVGREDEARMRSEIRLQESEWNQLNESARRRKEMASIAWFSSVWLVSVAAGLVFKGDLVKDWTVSALFLAGLALVYVRWLGWADLMTTALLLIAKTQLTQYWVYALYGVFICLFEGVIHGLLNWILGKHTRLQLSFSVLAWLWSTGYVAEYFPGDPRLLRVMICLEYLARYFMLRTDDALLCGLKTYSVVHFVMGAGWLCLL